jgi:hypothetical protein
VASKIIDELVGEAKVTVHVNSRLNRATGVTRDGSRLTALTLRDGRTFRGAIFIDATYEGDLMAAAGVSYRLGREANREFNETLNGVRFLEPERTAGIDPLRAGGRSLERTPAADRVSRARSRRRSGARRAGLQFPFLSH